MEKRAFARHFSELVVWKKSRELAKGIFEASKMFPEEEKYSLTNQIRRSSQSVGAQIAEAWAKRRYEKSVVSKLTDADGEQNETQHWLIVAMDSGSLDKETVSGFVTTKVRECDDTKEFFAISSDLYHAPITDY